MDSEIKNIAYIDGQNLYMTTSKGDPSWNIDLSHFRIYLDKKYNVTKAYYYLGFVQEGNEIEHLYEKIQIFPRPCLGKILFIFRIKV
ncbi:MAG: hypothetical protein KJ847_04080 [Firmicutes bacterium]|nr:hypothetical protein [Bacillota bacterium]